MSATAATCIAKRLVHPVASVFPLMEGRAFRDFVNDVRANGLLEPIWVHRDGSILDGRNRQRACEEIGIEPEHRTWQGPDEGLAQFVISMNLRRRQLNPEQCAFIAAELASMKRGDAAKTQDRDEAGRLDRKHPRVDTDKPLISRREAASAMGTTVRAVERARQVQAHAPELKQRVLARQKEEAALFLSRNTRISVRTFDKFRIRITAGDPVACDIFRIVQAAQLSLSSATTGTGHVSAVTALERIYRGCGIAGSKNGPEILGKTLGTISQAWGRESANFEGQVLEGIGLVLTRYGSKVDIKALVTQLAKIGGGAAGLIGKARGYRDMRGGSVAYCIAGLIIERYNRVKRSGKLESWWS